MLDALNGKLPNSVSIPALKSDTGKFLTTTDGYYYALDDVVMPLNIPSKQPDDGTFIAYDSIQFNPFGECEQFITKDFETEYKTDPTNPCGCTEIEVRTNYVTYPALSYDHPILGDGYYKRKKERKRATKPTAPIDIAKEIPKTLAMASVPGEPSVLR